MFCQPEWKTLPELRLKELDRVKTLKMTSAQGVKMSVNVLIGTTLTWKITLSRQTSKTPGFKLLNTLVG